jgi:IclR family mhp operon transcriptional activator
VFGCISIIWIRSALSLDEAIAQFGAPLLEAAAAIRVEP